MSVGYSADTLLAEVSWKDANGRVSKEFVIRTSPPPPGLLEPYDLVKQYRIMKGLAGSEVPVPAAFWLEEDETVLGRQFFVMEKVEGDVIQFYIPDYVAQGDPALRRRMNERFVDMLATIHAIDWAEAGLSFMGDGSTYIDDILAFWEGEMRRVRRGPLPSFERVVQWLHDNKPAPSPRVSLLHGDTKWGNVMWQGEDIAAVLDWEMSLLGDPLGDLAYFINSSYMTGDDTVCTAFLGYDGGLTRDEVIARYEEQTGLVLDRGALRWHEVMQSFKLSVIMLLAWHLFESGASNDLRYAELAPFGAKLALASLAKAGLGPLEVGDMSLSPARVVEAYEKALTDLVLPALGDHELARDQMRALLTVLRLTPGSVQPDEGD
jgi:aminoglycoside phosphotransferase (APT) family kinase protein